MHHTEGGSASPISGLPSRAASRITIPFDVPTHSFILAPPLRAPRRFAAARATWRLALQPSMLYRAPATRRSYGTAVAKASAVKKLPLCSLEAYRGAQAAGVREFQRRNLLGARKIGRAQVWSPGN